MEPILTGSQSAISHIAIAHQQQSSRPTGQQQQQHQYGAMQQEPTGQLQHIYDDLEVVSQESRDCSPPTGQRQFNGPAHSLQLQQQQQQQQRRDSAKQQQQQQKLQHQQQLREIYTAREIYDAVAASNSPHVIGQTGVSIVQPLPASRSTGNKPAAHQFYKDLGRAHADEDFYDE